MTMEMHCQVIKLGMNIFTYCGQNSHLKEVYTTSIVMAVDEHMVLLKCHSSMKECISMKPVRHGCKVWCLVYLRTEFVSSLVYIQGKKTCGKTPYFS
jgi:hypothetical protein